MPIDLEDLFGSKDKVKILRFFLNHNEMNVSLSELQKTLKIKRSSLHNEIKKLKNLGLIKETKRYSIPKNHTVPAHSKKGKKSKKPVIPSKKSVSVYFVNESFVFLNELQNIVGRSTGFGQSELSNQLSKVGQIKLALIAGSLINNSKARVDLLLVGNKLKDKKLQSIISDLEANIGKEVNYTVMNTGEFLERKGMGDVFIRDIFEWPNKILINRL
jgi:DNA-binding Lrp family transcriptional regulator